MNMFVISHALGHVKEVENLCNVSVHMKELCSDSVHIC